MSHLKRTTFLIEPEWSKRWSAEKHLNGMAAWPRVVKTRFHIRQREWASGMLFFLTQKKYWRSDDIMRVDFCNIQNEWAEWYFIDTMLIMSHVWYGSKSIVVDTFSYSPASVGLGKHCLFMLKMYGFLYISGTSGLQKVYCRYTMMHIRLRFDPLPPINYENDDHPAHAKMSSVLNRP